MPHVYYHPQPPPPENPYERMVRLNRESLADSVRPRATTEEMLAQQQATMGGGGNGGSGGVYQGMDGSGGFSPADVGGDWRNSFGEGGGPIQSMAEAQALNPPVLSPTEMMAATMGGGGNGGSGGVYQGMDGSAVGGVYQGMDGSAGGGVYQDIYGRAGGGVYQGMDGSASGGVYQGMEGSASGNVGGGTSYYQGMDGSGGGNVGGSMSPTEYLTMTQGSSNVPLSQDLIGGGTSYYSPIEIADAQGTSVGYQGMDGSGVQETYAERLARMQAAQDAAFIPKTADQIAARNAKRATMYQGMDGGEGASVGYQGMDGGEGASVGYQGMDGGEGASVGYQGMDGTEAQAPVIGAGVDTVGTGSVSGWGGGGGGVGGAAEGVALSPPTGTTDMMGGGGVGPGAMQGGAGPLPGQQQGPGAFSMPGIVDMSDYARYPMIEAGVQGVVNPYQGFNANPVMNVAAQRYGSAFQKTNISPIQNYAQRTAMQSVGGNQFGEQDVWEAAQGQMGQITPEMQAYMDAAQGGMSAANPYDQRMQSVIEGQNYGINANFDKSRTNLEHRFGTLNQLGSPAFRSAMKELETGRATQIGRTTADFNMAAANNDQGMRSQRLADFGGAVGMQTQQRNQDYSNLSSASQGRMQGGQTTQGIRSNRLQGMAGAGSLNMQSNQQFEDVGRGRLGDLNSAGQFGLAATRDREMGRSNRLNQLQSIQGQEYNQVRQKQQDQMGVINNMNQAQSGYDRAYANSMQQAQNNQDAGLQLGAQGLGSLSNPMGAAGTAMSGYQMAGTAGALAGQNGQNALSQVLTNPAVQDAAGDAWNWFTGRFGNNGSPGATKTW